MKAYNLTTDDMIKGFGNVAEPSITELLNKRKKMLGICESERILIKWK